MAQQIIEGADGYVYDVEKDTWSKPMAQTAVEWFQEKTWELKMLLEKQQISVDEYGVAYYDILEEAKQMEKEQMIELTQTLTSTPSHLSRDAATLLVNNFINK